MSALTHQDKSGQVWVAWADVYMRIKQSLPKDTDGFIAYYDLPENERKGHFNEEGELIMTVITMQCAFRLLWSALDGAS